MVNLSQIRNCDRIVDLFCDAMNELDLGIGIQRSPDLLDEEDSQAISIGEGFGYLHLSNFPGKLTSSEQAVVRNAVNMLAVVLGNRTNANALAEHNRVTSSRLAEIEQLHRRILETTPDIIYVAEVPSNTVLYCNGAIKEILGYEPAEILDLGDGFQGTLIHPDDKHRFEEHQAKLIASASDDSIFTIQHRIRRVDGTYRRLKCWERVFNRGEEGTVLTKIGTAVDFTRLLDAEEELRHSENRFRVAAECMSDLVFECDMASSNLTWFGDINASLGFAKGELSSFDEFMALVHEDDHEAVFVEVNKAMEHGIGSVRCRIQHKNGSWRTWLIRGRRAAGELIIGACVDLTEREKLQEQLDHVRRMEAVGQLAGGIAHDFNNLLSAITSPAELLKIKLPPGMDQLQNYLDMIIVSAERAADLTRKLLTFSRRDPTIRRPLDLRQVLEDTHGILKHTIDPKVRVVMNLPDERAMTIGSASDIQNAIINLAINARDAMPTGGRLEIGLGTTTIDRPIPHQLGADEIPPGVYQAITVSDTGLGIPEEALDRIFDPFFTTKGVGKGTGLGLAAVYGTVTAHQGGITVTSTPGKGTRFTLYFPFTTGDAEELDSKNEETRSGSGSVLIVDDELTIRESTKDLLEDLGYTVHTASDGAKGIQFYKEHGHEIDLCIVDLAMPKVGGTEVLSRIKARNPDAKVIILTGYLVDRQEENLLKQGAMQVLTKPLRLGQLSRIVSQALQ